MTPDECVGLVLRAYEALARGEIATILDALAEDVDFEVHGPPEVPFVGVFRGREGAAEFFRIVAEHTERVDERHAPEVHEVVPVGDQVFAYGSDRLRMRSNGDEFSGWWVHVFTFRDGRIARFRELFDAAAAVAAFRGRDRGASPEDLWRDVLAAPPRSPA